MAAADSFRTVRWLRTLNLLLQAVLVLTLFGGLNYVARKHPSRLDLTRHRRFSLAPETLSYLHALPRPVEVIVSLSEETENSELRGLLEEYVHATEGNANGRITTQYIDVYQDRRRAEEFGLEQPNAILLRSGEKRRAVLVDELYRMKNRQRESFLGEQVLTDALLDVSSSERKRIYFLVGHGELQPGDPDPARGLSLVRDQLRVRNFVVETLELSINRRIPADASLVVAVAPQTSFTRAEQEMDRPKRLQLLLDIAKVHRDDIGHIPLHNTYITWGVKQNVTAQIAPDNLFFWRFVKVD